MFVINGEWHKVMQKAVRWPCGVCCRSVGNNSIQCTSFQKWVHRKCSGVKGSIYKVMKTFVCRGCKNLVTSTGRTSVQILVSIQIWSQWICFVIWVTCLETWPIRKGNEVALQLAEMRMVGCMCGVKLQDTVPSKGLRERDQDQMT